MIIQSLLQRKARVAHTTEEMKTTRINLKNQIIMMKKKMLIMMEVMNQMKNHLLMKVETQVMKMTVIRRQGNQDLDQVMLIKMMKSIGKIKMKQNDRF
jgi:hypothetical protein